MTTSPATCAGVAKALEAVGARPVVTENPLELEAADAVILPGVGSGPAAMQALESRDLAAPLKNFITKGKPFLGGLPGPAIAP